MKHGPQPEPIDQAMLRYSFETLDYRNGEWCGRDATGMEGGFSPWRGTLYLQPAKEDFCYGDVVAVVLSTGEKLVGRIESNAAGVALRDWEPADVRGW